MSFAAMPFGPAHAGRPLQAEDAGVLDQRACEIEAAWSRLSEPGAPRAAERSLQLSCGIGVSSQLGLALSRVHAGGAPVDGLRLGGKSEAWHGPGEAPTAITLAWGLRSARAADAGWRHAATELLAALSVPVDGATVHVNLGHARDVTARLSTANWAVAWECASVGGWAPMAELFGDDRAAPWWNLGLRFTALPERLFLDLSFGRQMAPGRPTLGSVGFKLAF